MGKSRNNYDKGGRNHVLTGVENHLPAMQIYYRCYVASEFMGFLFDCDETTVMRAVGRIEKIAIRVIHIEKKREISFDYIKYLIADATEQPVRCPKKKQIITDPEGRGRGFLKTYPEIPTALPYIKKQKRGDWFPGIPKKADNGYQWVRKYDRTAQIPYKNPRGGELTSEQRDFNRRLSKKRIKAEHVIDEGSQSQSQHHSGNGEHENNRKRTSESRITQEENEKTGAEMFTLQIT